MRRAHTAHARGLVACRRPPPARREEDAVTPLGVDARHEGIQGIGSHVAQLAHIARVCARRLVHEHVLRRAGRRGARACARAQGCACARAHTPARYAALAPTLALALGMGFGVAHLVGEQGALHEDTDLALLQRARRVRDALKLVGSLERDVEMPPQTIQLLLHLFRVRVRARARAGVRSCAPPPPS
eukprot:scaffold72775_cov36-Phaeocystis_antarctica.AAC.1